MMYIPPHLHLADPSIARDFLAGQIVLAGRSILTSEPDPFDAITPSAAFAEVLHQFEWLRHFEASNEGEIRAGATIIVKKWLKKRELHQILVAEQLAVVPIRLIHWLTHFALLSENADFSFYQNLLKSMAQDAAIARCLAKEPLLGILHLHAAIAYLYYELALERPEKAISTAEKLLTNALHKSVFADGGTKDRDASSTTYIAACLISIMALYRARQRVLPEIISEMLFQMIGFIRMMQHPDGGLALMSQDHPASRDLVAQVLRYGEGRVPRLHSAPETGFERLEDEFAVLIADSGVLPPPAFGTHAHASALAFEFSSKSERLIISCGCPPFASQASTAHFRAGAAHSTLLLNDTALVELRPSYDIEGEKCDQPYRPSPALAAQNLEQDQKKKLILRHPPLKAAGYKIERVLSLLPEGKGLEGRDRIIALPDREDVVQVTLAFHLHPHLLPVPLSRSDAIVLRSQRRTHETEDEDALREWMFEAPGSSLYLEDSVCYEQELIQSKTEAILLDLTFSGTMEIYWRLTPFRPDGAPSSAKKL